MDVWIFGLFFFGHSRNIYIDPFKVQVSEKGKSNLACRNHVLIQTCGMFIFNGREYTCI
jgi:hypothetical protein